MTIVTVHADKTTDAQLVMKAEAEEESVIAHGKDPASKLVPFVVSKRHPGRWKGQFTIGPEFFEPLPEEEPAIGCGTNLP